MKCMLNKLFVPCIIIPFFLYANEKDYQATLCSQLGGIMEYRLQDGSRVDCLTDEYSIEVDFSKKWKEAVGQALYYGIETNRQPAIAVITNGKDDNYLKRLESVSTKYNIKIFYIKQ